MRTCLIALAATLSLVGFIAPSTAGSAPGGSSGGGAHGGGGGGGGHTGGGGGGWRGGGGGGGSHGSGGSRRVGGGDYGAYAIHGGDTRRGTPGSYVILGYESAGLGRTGPVSRDEPIPRNTLVVGPRTGIAATARRVTDRRVIPERPRKHREKRCFAAGCALTEQLSAQLPLEYCPSSWDPFASRFPVFDCPSELSVESPPRPRSRVPEQTQPSPDKDIQPFPDKG